MAKKTAGVVVLLVFAGLQASSARLQLHGPQPSSFPCSIKSVFCFCLYSQISGGPYALCNELHIHGSGFGGSRVSQVNGMTRTRVVVVDGREMTEHLEYFSWSDTGIACSHHALGPIALNRVYRVAIGERISARPDSKVISSSIVSPEYPFRLLIKWPPESPALSGRAGDIIQAVACGIVPPQGNLVLMIGSTPVNKVITWGTPEGHLNFVVPKMAPGTYDLYIEQGGTIVSDKKHFTVIY